MTNKAEIKKVLVVLSPDLIKPNQPTRSPLVQRAVSLAKISGCELELFHVCYDGGLEFQLFKSEADLAQRREELVDEDATLLAEMAARLKSEGIDVRFEARWDSPRTDAVLRKIAQAQPDIVMKQAREHNFVLGISTNTDWDLVRRSPAHVWLVNENVDDIDRILVAVGNKFGDPGDITTAADYDLFRTANLVGTTFKADIHAVNAYQVPEPQRMVTAVDGAVAPVAPIVSTDEQNRLRTQIVKQHSGSVKALAQYFNVAKDKVHIREGQPTRIIPEFAESINSDMIVMGANSIGRFERLVSSVTVEPVLADTSADVLVVRERDLAQWPRAVKSPLLYGVPKYDLETAITDPEATFDSPNEVVNLPEISVELRNRILQAWEYDIRAEMMQEDEGGPVRDTNVNALDEIYAAKELLAMQQEKSTGNGRMALHGAGR